MAKGNKRKISDKKNSICETINSTDLCPERTSLPTNINTQIKLDFQNDFFYTDNATPIPIIDPETLQLTQQKNINFSNNATSSKNSKKSLKKLRKDKKNAVDTSHFISTWFPKHQSNYFKRKVSFLQSDSKKIQLDSLVLGFCQSQKLVFQGAVLARLVKGSAEIAGNKLVQNQWVRVYSAALQSLFYIQSTPLLQPDLNLSLDSNHNSLFKDYPASFQELYSKIVNNHETVIEVVQSNCGIMDIEQVSPIYKYLFYPKRYKKPDSKNLTDPKFRLELDYRRDVSIQGFYPIWSLDFNFSSSIKTSALKFLDSWNAIASDLIRHQTQLQTDTINCSDDNSAHNSSSHNNLDPNIKIIIAGQKSSGKSTFSRFLRAKFSSSFEKVYYLETDLGQPDLGPIGVVALHVIYIQRVPATTDIYFDSEFSSFKNLKTIGPPFASSSNYYYNSDPSTELFDENLETSIDYRGTLLGAINLGTTTSKYNPERYISAIQKMVSLYHSQTKTSVSAQDKCNYPLIVNTQGWVKSLGLDLLADICDIVQPTHYLQMSADTLDNRFYVDDMGCLPEFTIRRFVPIVFSETEQNGMSLLSPEHQEKRKPSITLKPPYSLETLEIEITPNNSFKDNVIPEDSQSNLVPRDLNNQKFITETFNDDQIVIDQISKSDDNGGNNLENEPISELSPPLNSDDDDEKFKEDGFGLDSKPFDSRSNIQASERNNQSKLAISNLMNIRNHRAHTFDSKSISILSHLYGFSFCPSYGTSNKSSLDSSSEKCGHDKWLFNLPLVNRLPVIIPFKSVTIFLCENDVDACLIPRLLNGSLVSVSARILVEESMDSEDYTDNLSQPEDFSMDDTSGSKSKTKNLSVVNSWPSLAYEFLSYAVIHFVDLDSACFHLLLPPSARFPRPLSHPRDYNSIQLAFSVNPGPQESGVELPLMARSHGATVSKSNAIKLGGISSDSDLDLQNDSDSDSDPGTQPPNNTETSADLDADTASAPNRTKKSGRIITTKFGGIDIPYLATSIQ
ncbi:Polynucleotide 5'-hydroxyl-kinase nol9 [Smittium mucronatum]|uniref:Polynucleotide 5'-hydroxyl-kinase GRC3 n=1 Tax=Smittium mucronatum TaxID=133383 RepID=A0A1R0GPS1_9FUNG|nr:Polynucleotide 5'-hydroxyl-kinase nol9 [Smittium mucronatum]